MEYFTVVCGMCGNELDYFYRDMVIEVEPCSCCFESTNLKQLIIDNCETNLEKINKYYELTYNKI